MTEIPAVSRNVIDNADVAAEGDARIAVEDPATARTLAEAPRAAAPDVDRAVRAARACADAGTLSEMPPAERAALMHRLAGEVRALAADGGELLCRESGKPLAHARGEFDEAARYFDYYGGLADKLEGRSIPLGEGYLDYTVAEPYGVSAQIVPWNFPVAIAARSLACALATGNASVIKAPEEDPLALLLLGRAVARAGIPAGAVNIVCGTGEAAGAALVNHPGVDQIVFTGSVPTGQSILHAAAERVVPCVMELGGKSAAVVCEDADLDEVVASVRSGIFANAGQICSAMSRLVVPERLRARALEAVVELSRGLSIGPGIEDHDLTPLISAEQLDRVENDCLAAEQEGARVATGGRRVADSAGHFMQPTVLDGVTPDMTVARKEIFGPVLSVQTHDGLDDAVRLANATDYGLCAGVFTHDLTRAHWAARRLRAGQVFVNEWFAGGVETPFGGTGKSGFGREKGQEALLNYLQTKNVAVRLSPR